MTIQKSQPLLPVRSLEKIYEKHKEEILKNAPGSSKLLVAPEDYATDAIRELKRQLETVKSPNKKRKIQARIVKWEKALNVLGDNNGSKKKTDN